VHGAKGEKDAGGNEHGFADIAFSLENENPDADPEEDDIDTWQRKKKKSSDHCSGTK